METLKFKSARDPDNPTIFTAVCLNSDNQQAAAIWCGGQTVVEHDAVDPSKTYPGINVPTFMGFIRASDGDYIYQGESDHFYVMKPGIFNRMFSPAE